MDASIILIVGLVIPLSEIVIVSPNKMNLLHTCLTRNELAASHLCRQVEKDEVSDFFFLMSYCKAFYRCKITFFLHIYVKMTTWKNENDIFLPMSLISR